MTQKDVSRKNYYFAETLQAEIKKYQIISFEVFDTLLLGNDFFPMDPLVPVAESAEAEAYCTNRLMTPLYKAALALGKPVWLLAETGLSEIDCRALLEAHGFGGWARLFVFARRARPDDPSPFQSISQEEGIPEGWLHIGVRAGTEIGLLRQLGISTAPYLCPRDCWIEEQLRQGEGVVPGRIPVVSRGEAERINICYTHTEAPKEDVVIQADRVSMRFNMSPEKVDNLKEYVVRLLRGKLVVQEFWALRDVGFSIRRGERVGLIGLNGSGKSTMLKIVSGVMKPTEGTVKVQGSIAPMIELGAGFDFELSARENIYLNGAVLGYSNQEMKRCYEGIIEFSELWEFQDVAIKNFSSGMIARLGFAIATCRATDVLIIDEILSVGDAAFQKKCFQKMEELTCSGVTVLLVSHSAEDIIRMCDRAIWLDHGSLVMQGESRYVVNQYLERLASR